MFRIKVTLSSVVLLTVFFTGYGQSLKLPSTSNVYPDTFAIYWTDGNSVLKGKNISIKISCNSIYGDLSNEVKQTNDSIVSLLFAPEFHYENALAIEWSFLKSSQVIYEQQRSKLKVLKVLQKNEKIEALKSLVDTKPRIENLRMLAEIYEEEKCYVNAFYIYYKILLQDRNLGTTDFLNFYNRNSQLFDNKFNNVMR
jgi:hypothetical protein